MVARSFAAIGRWFDRAGIATETANAILDLVYVADENIVPAAGCRNGFPDVFHHGQFPDFPGQDRGSGLTGMVI